MASTASAMAAMTRNLVSWEGRWFMITSVKSP